MIWPAGSGSLTVIVTGMPAAGKSTVTHGFASMLDRSARLDGDNVGEMMIIKGRVWALGEPADEASRQVELGIRNLCSLARNFCDAGFTSVIDTVIPDRAQLELFIELLAPRPVLLVVLAPGTEACKARNRGRSADQAWEFDGYDQLDRSMRAEFGDLGWWLDTADQTPEQTAELIFTSAQEHAKIA